MTKQWTAEDVLGMVRSFQPACVLAAAAELGVFDAVAEAPPTAEELSARIAADLRATAMLGDALTSMGLLTKRGERYRLASGIAELLTETGRESILAMVRHQANCLRSWAQLAGVAKSGRPARRTPSVRGARADTEAFIEAMEVASRSVAPRLVAALGPPPFHHLLDIGGGPGTWTIAFLRAAPQARATLFDLPEVIPIARRHIAAAGLADRATLVSGDIASAHPLPAGADLAWISAIVHINSREENRRLFAKTLAALSPGGKILARDFVMEDSRIAPAAGAMFAINMLVNTPRGGTYTRAELSEDLLAAGFCDPAAVHQGEAMDSVMQATKP